MKENFFYEKGIVHDNSSPERCNFSEKKMIYKVLQDHVLQDLGLTPRNLKDATKVKNVPYKEQDIWKKKFFYENGIVHDNGSPERSNFSEKKMIYKVLQDLRLTPCNLKDATEVKNVPYKEQDIWKKIFFMKMVLYMTMAHLKGAIFLKRNYI